MNWMQNDLEIKSHDDLDPMCTDIVYMLYFDNGQQYVGKKTVRSKSTLPVLKTKTRDEANVITRHILRDEEGKIITGKASRKEARARGLKAKAEQYEEVVTNKPFMKYEGSSTETADLKVAHKEILYQCSNKMTATYLEAMVMFDESVLFNPLYINANILGKFYDNAIDGLIENPLSGGEPIPGKIEITKGD